MLMDTKEMRAAPVLFQGERWLAWTGLLGFLLAAACAVWAIANGGATPPEGDVWRAFSFDAALGMFVLSTAAILPLAGLGSKSRSVFRWAYVSLALYAYGVETVQQFRGIDPRFTKVGALVDILLGSIFGLVAVLLIAFYIVLASGFFRRKTLERRPGMVLGIRYSMLAVMVSFAAGIWISVTQSRYTGNGGNVIWLHGLGFHALQALPALAWLAEKSALPGRTVRLALHTAGSLYLLGLAAIGTQTALGRPVWEMSALPLSALACFVAGLGIGLLILRFALLAGAPNPSVNRHG